MKILLFSHSYLHPEVRKNIYALAKHAKVICVSPTHAHMGVFRRHRFAAEVRHPELFAVRRPLNLFRSQYLLIGLGRLVKTIRPDVVLVEYNPWSAMFLQALFWTALSSRRSRLVCSVKKNTYRRTGGISLRDIVARWLVRRVDHFIAASDMVARMLKDEFGIPKEKISVCPHLGIDTALFCAPTQTAPSGGASKVGYVGRFDAEKGVVDLVDAVDQVRRNSCTSVELHLLGGGSSEGFPLGALQECSSRFPWLRLCAPVPNAAVADFLGGLNVFVLPSRNCPDHEEHDARALLEAMSSGLACVGTTSGVVPEILGGGAGLLVPARKPSLLAQSIRRLLEDDDLRSQIAHSARQRIEDEFALDVVATRKIQILRETLHDSATLLHCQECVSR